MSIIKWMNLKRLEDKIVYHVTLECNNDSIMSQGLKCGHTMKNSYFSELCPDIFLAQRKMIDRYRPRRIPVRISREKAIYAYTSIENVYDQSFGTKCFLYAIRLSSYDNIRIADTSIINSILRLKKTKDKKREAIKYWNNSFTPKDYLTNMQKIESPEVLICEDINPDNIVKIGTIDRGFLFTKNVVEVMKGSSFINFFKYLVVNILIKKRTRHT